MPRVVRRQTVFVLVFLVVVVLFMTTFRMGVVRGASMEPTFTNGQLVLVRRSNFFSGALRHKDVVLLRKDRDVIIKRVYRLPGEEIDDTYPNVREFTRRNGLTDYYEQTTVDTPSGPETRYFVPKDYIVVLGDNLNVSEDSRFFGPVPIRDVLGSVVNAAGPPYSMSAPKHKIPVEN